MPSQTQLEGQHVEQEVALFLQRQGLKKLNSNYRSPYGEIDLIMGANQLLVFVEVRKRNSSSFGSAVATVTQKKQMKIIKTAQHFLQQQPVYAHCHCRFDVVGVGSEQDAKLCWIRDAFQLPLDLY